VKSLFQGFSKGILLLLDIPRLYIPACSNSVQLVVFHSVIILILCFTITELKECMSEVEQIETKANNSSKIKEEN
jgi:hypothetical protein